jgi:peroxiredoxin
VTAPSPEPLTPSIGQAVLHLFCHVGLLADAEAIRSSVSSAEADGVQVVTVAMLGHKSDIGFMCVGPDQWRLRRIQTELVAAGLELTDSYVSLTELSEYSQGVPEEMKQTRLHPQLPPEGKAAFCFYPMSKKRDSSGNWFTLPYDERKELMYAHGTSGRKFAGRVVQVITGSTGIDDYEWGVTLFAVRPDDLKEVVYTMRFDEASAVYADFGPFLSGAVGSVDDVLSACGVE